MDGDVSEVRAWTDGLLRDDAALTLLAKAMTGQSWSFGMGGFGGLGDRVARARAEAHIKADTDIVDVAAFRNALERIIAEERLDKESREAISTFLSAWDRPDRRRRDGD